MSIKRRTEEEIVEILREAEAAFVDALYSAFAQEREPDDALILGVLGEQVPLSKMMPEQIQGLRKWAKGRARPATSIQAESKGRRIAS